MSRSYKKAYAYFACCRSQKQWRRDYNRRFRHAENANLRKDHDYACHKNPYKFFYADFWTGPTDGRAHYIDPRIEWWCDPEWTKRRFCKFRKHGHALFRK